MVKIGQMTGKCFLCKDFIKDEGVKAYINTGDDYNAEMEIVTFCSHKCRRLYMGQEEQWSKEELEKMDNQNPWEKMLQNRVLDTRSMG